MKVKMFLPELPDGASEKSDMLLPAYEAACKQMADYLTGKTGGSDKVKIAATVISGYGRIVASETNKIGLRMMAARQLPSGDDDPSDKDKVRLLKSS